MPTNTKGSARERELINILHQAGLAVMRAPASGAATPKPLPDALAGDGESFHAIEAKSSGGDPVYIDEDEIEALEYFAGNFGATAVIATRFDSLHGDPSYGTDQEPWYFFRPDECYTTDSGNYRIKKETALEEGTTFESFVRGGVA